MDQTGQYSGLPPHTHHSSARQMFQSAQLPPPSQLHHLAPSSYSRSNTLPPIPALAPNLSSRYPPASYHPSLASASSPTLPPLPSNSSSQLPWPTHRTSSSRDERYPPRTQDIKVKPLLHDPIPPPPSSQTDPQKESEDNMPPTSDFVKKLYKMLEDSSFQRVVSWGPNGDCFVVKDMNEFTKSILPRMFKHSNFASFVRQLNKYDFHKVKNTDDSQFGEHSWTFRHPDFHADRRDALENIKRKVPAARKSLPSRGPHGESPSPSAVTIETLQAQVERLVQTQDDMTAHIRHLENNYQNVLTEMVNFQRNMAQQDGLMQNLISYFLQMENGKTKAEEAMSSYTSDANPFLPTQEAQRMMGSYPETDVARASLFQLNEISRRAEVAGMSFTTNASGAASTSATAPPTTTGGAPTASTSTSAGNATPGPSHPTRPRSAQQIFAAAAGLLVPQLNPSDGDTPLSRQDTLARIEELQRNRPQSAQGTAMGADGGASAPSGSDPFIMPTEPPTDGTMAPYGAQSLTHEGLQVFTLGHLLPRSSEDDANGNWSFDANTLNGLLPLSLGGPEDPEVVNPSPTTASGGPAPFDTARPNSAQTLRVRRSTFVPGWAVPPRVLLVEDDAVSRKLSSKFLQVFGCAFDVAVDGVGAVNKMNLEKYDLVLMDIVMPKLDGVSATNMIRQFDHMTPIISMTSNSKPNEIMTYYHSGMNDILPKPFTKEGLLEMLEAIQQMGKFPSRALGPADTAAIEEDAETSLAVQPSVNPPVDDGGRIDPLVGMGLTQQQYQMILQGLVSGGGAGVGVDGVLGPEKRSLDDADDERDGKRGRFEVLE
ncbi:HSF-type DNA-binding-domain-containing protein [Gloeopeniophorella convolvens]|nr:HSF-type DNA-binding-domain-containing protein [Gloeopeniophorella convolvens]